MTYDNPLIKRDNAKRNAATLKASVLSMLLNILLAAAKIVCGILFGAISVLADGLNNLSDCGSNIITVTGIKMSNKPADKEHPYGHARGEYIAAMAVAFIILLLAAELFMESIEKIIGGMGTEFSIFAVIALSLSISVKIFMFFYNNKMGKKYNSEILLATATDSMSDVIATSVVLVSLIVMRFTSFNPDGYVSCLVAFVIAFSGIKILKRTASELLGKSLDKNLTDQIKQKLLSYDGVYGIHDLSVHNYVNKYHASVHVEIDETLKVCDAHEIIDKIERDFLNETDIVLTIHLDPVSLGDRLIAALKTAAEEIVKNIDVSFTLHDFHKVECDDKIRVIFEVCVPYGTKTPSDVITATIIKEMSNRFNENISYEITVEHELTQ